MDGKLVQLISSFESAEHTGNVARESLEYLSKSGNGNGDQDAHGRLCRAMLKAAELGGNSDMGRVLHFKGEAEALTVVYNNAKHTKIPTAKWLANEVLKLLESGGLTSILISNSKGDPNTPSLSVQGEHIVGVICRLPSVLANRLGHQLKDALFPKAYFKRVGKSLLESLEYIHRSFEEGKESSWSLLFAASLLGKAASLGHQNTVMECFVPSLEVRVVSQPLWSRLSQSLFSRLPSANLEAVLEHLVNYTSPSLLPSSPLCSLIGSDLHNHHKVKFVLTHKLILVRVPLSSHAVYNILGYLASTGTGRGLIGKLLQSALEVWSDGTSLRHMDSKQHIWISQVIVLGVSLLLEGQEGFEQVKQSLLKLTMSGVEIHIQSPLDDVRRVGMAVGECLINKLNKASLEEKNKLKFEYVGTPETEAIEKLARPISEQEEDLKEEMKRNTVIEGGGGGNRGGVVVEGGSLGNRDVPPSVKRFGEGLVHTVDCSDSDSDDDLKPYALDDDPDSTLPAPPRYLRNLMQDLLSTKEPQKVEIALGAAESLIKSKPSDLSEVCVELIKILFHLSDSFSLDNFSSQRHRSMVALATLCPKLVVPYLTQEFYAPNYSLRHRMDILEVISSSSLELSSPTSPAEPVATPTSSFLPTRKPWEDIISQRLKSKTRVISHGPTKSPLKPVPNRFINVAPLFFFPLMSRYDHRQNTLDLLGEDSLVLGNLLYTLGTVMYASANIPLVSTMAVTFLDFLWTIRYHHDAYVRQGVLYGLGMILWSTPLNALLEDLTTGLAEAVAWIKEVAGEDADERCREMARHSLTLLNASIKQQQT